MADTASTSLTIHLKPPLSDRIIRRASKMGVTAEEVIRRAIEASDLATASVNQDSGTNLYDVLSAAGLIGRLESPHDSPTDFSTNPTHMEGFGSE